MLCCVGSVETYDFKSSISSGRDDFGSFTYFKYDALEKCIVEVDGSSFVQLKIQVVLEHIFLPPTIPSSHNSKASTNMVGLANLGATCYLNSLLQMLYHINRFRKAVYQLPHEHEEDPRSSTTLALQALFKNLQFSNSEVSTKDLTLSFGWTTNEAFMQQDVQEMMRILLDRLEDKMKGTTVDGMIKDLFCGKVRSYIRCIHVNYESKREEDFYDIQLDVKGCKTIYESFQKYIEVENLDGENQYDAGSEHGKQDAKKGVIFTKFPPVLTIHLKRFDFDFESMGFKKIHDNFEFPTVLDVGKYLAEDAEEEISSGSHRYLLHSVLVHAGDVGGGHYYAYIRPGTDQNYQEVYAKTVDDAVINSPSFTFYDKSPQASQAKTRSTSGEGQFYKFNDELVSAASSKEAVEACYGRRVSPYFKDVIHTMNSAYMLVYIRQEEAKDIMTPITSEDIPTSLLQRLVEEQRKRKQIQAKATHQKRYCNIYYATEKHVANFVDYSKSQYFISTPHMQSMQMMVDSTRLGVLLRIASELDISPVLLKLWRIGNRVRDASVNDPLIIQEDLSTKELSATIDESHFFVQKVSLVGDGSQNNYQELQDTFTKEYMLLKEKESEWLQVVRDALKEHTEWYEIGLPLDPCYGCGIGMSNKILEELRSHDEDLYDNLVKEMTSLTLHMMNILLEFGIEHLRLYGQPKSAQETSTLQRTEDDEDKAETALVFFKVFDPYNMLPTTFNNSLQTTPSSAASKTRMDIDEQVSSTAQDSGSNSLGVYNIVNHFTADDAGITAFNQTIQQLATSPSSDSQHPQEMTGNESIDFFTEKKAVQQYMPLKYFGYVALNPDDNVKKLYSVALKLINRSNKYTNYTYPEVWLKSEHIQLHYYQTALRVMPATVFASDDSENTLFSLLSEKDRHDKDKDNDYPLSVVLIISIKPHYYTHSTMTIPRHIPYLEQPELWCKYFVNQRRFYIQPLGPAELRALYNQYLIDQAERHKQQFNDNGLPLIRKRVLEASDGDNKDSSTSPVPSVRIKSGLEMTISVLHTMQETVEMIANELQVNPQHLVLFLVPMYVDPITQQVSNNAVDPYEFAKDVALPITMYGSLTEDARFPRTGREPLSAFFARHKYNQPRCYNTFLLLYQLVPYPIQLPPNLSADEDEEDVEGKDEEGAQEMKGSGDSKENAQNKKSDRIIEIILGDEYLRQRRKRYLEHVFSEQLRLYQPRDVLFQDINADLITQQSSSAKRRKTLTWEQGHSNHAATSTSTDYFQEDEPCLVDVKFPLNPYHILEAHRMLIKISADMTVHDLLRHIRNMLNIPVEYSTDDQDETEKQCLHMIKRKIPTLVSEHIQASHDTSKDHFPNIYLALHSIHQGMLVTTLTHDRSLYEFPANW